MKRQMIDIELARQILSTDGFFRNHAVEVLELEQGKVSLRVPLESSVVRLGGIMSGAAIMAFSDAASALCALTVEGVVNEVTADLSTSFYQPIRVGPVIFSSSLRKGGMNLAFCHSEVRDGNGVLCAESSGTYKVYR